MSRRRKKVKDRATPAQGFVTPPRGPVTVDMERIQSVFLQLEINTGTTSADSNSFKVSAGC